MKEPQLYVITLLALQAHTDGTQLSGTAGASTVLTVQLSYAGAEAEGWQSVYDKYPATDGWFEHQVTVFELSKMIETDGHQVTFTISQPERTE